MGLDKSFFVGQVPADCVCPICQDVLEEATEAIICQHGFCGDCIYTWLREHRSCPCCRSPITVQDLRPIHRVWREKLSGLRMKCHNVVHGCTAEVSIDELPGHLSTCQYAHVACPHESCPEVVLVTELEEHTRSCRYRKVVCDDCGLQFLATESAAHNCIASLRQYMCEQIEAAKKEAVTECMKMMRKDRRSYESALQEQRKVIDDLQQTVINMASQQHMRTTNRISTINLGHSTSCSQGVSSYPTNHHRTAEGRNLSLPRLAPLHTHMNLPRTGDRSRSRSGENYPRSRAGDNYPR